jgi:hypothetical protein
MDGIGPAMNKGTWEWLVVVSGFFTLFVVLVLILTSIMGKYRQIEETVTWYQTQVKPALEAQRAREQQILAQAAQQQAAPTPSPTPTPTAEK